MRTTQSTLAIRFRMRIVREQWATACALYDSNWLPYAHCTLTKHKTFDVVYAYKEQNILRFATVCALYASNLLPYAHCTLAMATTCTVYANKANHMLICQFN
jgi:hypothetical protein